MAYQKIYSREHWENFPSEKTAINRDRLNNIEGGIDAIDDRVCALDTTKVDLTKANELVKEILWDESNGTLTVIKMNGSQAVIDTKLEKLAVNFKYDPESQQLIITLDDGTEQGVDLSSLITEYEFLDSDTIAFEIADGKVKAIVKNGSITEDHLAPDYLGEIRTQVGRAETSAKSANVSEKNAASSSALAKSYAVGGTGTRDGEDTDNAKYYAEQAKNASDVGALAEALEQHTSNKNIHVTDSEKSIVSKLGESTEGTLTFNGSEIKTNTDYVADTLAEAQKAVEDGLIEDGATVYVKEGTNDAIGVATASKVGLVKPDGKTIDIDQNGIIKVKGFSVTKTLKSADWSGDTSPFSQTILVDSVNADSYVELTVPSNISLGEVESYQSACIISGTVNNGSITVNAYGEKPSINLPLLIIVRGC